MDGEITGRIMGELLELRMVAWAAEPCPANKIPYLDQKRASYGWQGGRAGKMRDKNRDSSVSQSQVRIYSPASQLHSTVLFYQVYLMSLGNRRLFLFNLQICLVFPDR